MCGPNQFNHKRFVKFYLQHIDITADDSLSRGSSATLLSVLDDKNRAIEVLQRQLQNQKLQLGYYIKNALKPSKIIQLSKTVSNVSRSSLSLISLMTLSVSQTQ